MLEGNVTWLPDCHAKDSKAAPANFGSANLTQIPQSGQGGYQPKGNCHGCGKPGHYKRDCPGSGRGGSGRGGRGGSGLGRGTDNRSEKTTSTPASETPLRHVNG